MVKKKNVHSESFVEKISAIFKFYLEGITILLLFLPGIMHQVNFLGVNISQYNGLSIILFLTVSFYYSLFFITGGLFCFLAIEGKKVLDNGKYDAFGIALFSIGIYFVANIKNILFDNFWYSSVVYIILFFIISKLWREFLDK